MKEMKALEILKTYINKNIGMCAVPQYVKYSISGLEEAMKPKTCEWSLVDDHLNIWSGQCGADWHLIDGTPSKNEMLFCHRCGGKLIEIEPKD